MIWSILYRLLDLNKILPHHLFNVEINLALICLGFDFRAWVSVKSVLELHNRKEPLQNDFNLGRVGFL